MADVLFLEGAQGNLCSYKAVRKVHEVNHHKGKEQWISKYRNAGGMSPDLVVKSVHGDIMEASEEYEHNPPIPKWTQRGDIVSWTGVINLI